MAIQNKIKQYLTEQEALAIKELFKRNLKSYREKDPSVTDKQWLQQIMRIELPEMAEEAIEQEADEILKSISDFNQSLNSCTQAGTKGISKERWLSDTIQKSSANLTPEEKTANMEMLYSVLYNRNEALAADLYGEQPQEEIADDMKPKEESLNPLKEIVMGKLEEKAKEFNKVPEIDYSPQRIDHLALNIGKSAAVAGLQSAATTAGLALAEKILDGQEVNGDELVTIALQTGKDTSLKVITAGTLNVAVKKGIIKKIPKNAGGGILANIACIGVENIKILEEIATGKLSFTKGLDKMGQVTCAAIGGLAATNQGAALGAAVGSILGPLGTAVGGVVGGIVANAAGSKVAKTIYETGKKVASAAKSVAKAAWSGIKSVASSVVSGIWSGIKSIFSIFS